VVRSAIPRSWAELLGRRWLRGRRRSRGFYRSARLGGFDGARRRRGVGRRGRDRGRLLDLAARTMQQEQDRAHDYGDDRCDDERDEDGLEIARPTNRARGQRADVRQDTDTGAAEQILGGFVHLVAEVRDFGVVPLDPRAGRGSRRSRPPNIPGRVGGRRAAERSERSWPRWLRGGSHDVSRADRSAPPLKPNRARGQRHMDHLGGYEIRTHIAT
jgi:hypothetical protein